MTIENHINTVLDTTLNALFNQSATEMGIQSVTTRHNGVIELHLTTGFPTGALQKTLQNTLQTALPHEKMHVTLDHLIQSHLTQMPGKGLRGIKNTIAIGSGKGGVGKSTVTVNLGIALARAGARVGILDADIYGPSIPLMLGKSLPIQIKDERYLPAIQHGIQAMSIGYLMHDEEQPLIWRGPMLAKSLIQMIDMTAWDNLDYLLIDLPPGTGDIQLSLVQKIPLTGAVIVTTPQNVATMDAQKALKMFATTGIDVLGIVENMSLHTCTQCGHQSAIFKGHGINALCQQHHCKLLGQLPLDHRVSEHCDAGRPTTTLEIDDLGMAFMNTALLMAIELSKKQRNYANKFPPIVVE